MTVLPFSYKSPSVFGRIAVAWKLLFGLRGQELQSVGSWIERNYAESGHGSSDSSGSSAGPSRPCSSIYPTPSSA